MDITTNEIKIMKVKQLRRLIRESISEVLNEAGAIRVKKGDTASIKKYTAQGIDVKEDPTMTELARLAKGFRLADPTINATQYANKRVSGTSMADVIDFFRENPGAEKTALQAQFNFVRPQIANAVVNGLLDAGVLVKLSAGGEVEAIPEPGEERPETIDGPESFLIGGGDPLAGMFDGTPNDDGSEDFNDSEEPTIDDTEVSTSTSSSSMSDEDYDAWMKWSDLNDRLSATKSNILKAKRNKGGKIMGDIGDTSSSSEIPRLVTLKQSLEDRMNALVAKSKYLQTKIEKETGKTYEPIEIEPEEEEDTLDEIYNAEYEKRKLQFYAGIIK